MESLKPYRAVINDLDRQIIDLLRARYDVIEAVSDIKVQENIPAVLPDRIEEVRENAAAMAAEKGLDADFIRSLYQQIIDHSCALEEEIIARKKAS